MSLIELLLASALGLVGRLDPREIGAAAQTAGIRRTQVVVDIGDLLPP